MELRTEKRTFTDKDGKAIEYNALYVEVEHYGDVHKIDVTIKNPYDKKLVVSKLD